MKKRLALLAIALIVFLGPVLFVGYKLWLFPFPQISRFVYKQPEGFRARRGERDYLISDNVAGHIHRPFAVRNLEWKEHPEGTIRLVVNNLGFREDDDTAAQKPNRTYRILVTGDSHTDGVVYNSESFANQLEHMLNDSYEDPVFEVINGGTGHYDPYNYAGFLHKFTYLQPDMFVVVIFTGNDFLELIQTAALRDEAEAPVPKGDYRRRLKEAVSLSVGAVCQGLNQAFYFKTYPELEDTALDLSFLQMMDIARTCKNNNIELLVLTLPTKFDVPCGDNHPIRKPTGETLGLNEEDWEINRRMGRRLLERLSAAGVRTLDPLATMQESATPLYWEADFHLNHTGHKLLATITFEHLETLSILPSDCVEDPNSAGPN